MTTGLSNRKSMLEYFVPCIWNCFTACSNWYNWSSRSFSEENKYYVWIVENNTLVKLPIEIGLEGDIYTQVKTDLSNKEIVVPLSSGDKVEEGAKVKFKEWAKIQKRKF